MNFRHHLFCHLIVARLRLLSNPRRKRRRWMKRTQMKMWMRQMKRITTMSTRMKRQITMKITSETAAECRTAARTRTRLYKKSKVLLFSFFFFSITINCLGYVTWAAPRC